MRWRFVAALAAATILCGCRNVLGIPEGGVLAYTIGGRIDGVHGASDPPVELFLDDQILMITEDGEFTFAEPLLDLERYTVTASPSCELMEASGEIASANVNTIRVTCDGLVALADFGFTAPMETTPGLGRSDIVYTTRGSYLTQSSRVRPSGRYPNATMTSYASGSLLQGNATIGFGPIPMLHGSTVRVDVTNADLLGPPVPRQYTTMVSLANQVAQFGFGKPLDVTAGDHVGSVLAADGEYLAVGMPERGGGQVVVFKRAGRKWTEAQVLGVSGSARFGAAIAMSGVNLLVGAPGTSNNAGAAYLFVRNGAGVWENPTAAGTFTGAAGSELGAAVALSQTLLAIGAPNDGGGAVRLHTILTGAPFVAAVRASNAEAGDHFGAAIAIAEAGGVTLAVGAPGEDSASTPSDNSFPDAGAIYLRSGASLAAETYLKAGLPGAGDAFGSAVALVGGGAAITIAVGAPLEDAAGEDPSDNSSPGAGAVYLFSNSSGSWLQQYVKSPTSTCTSSECKRGDGFGSVLAIADKHLAVGAPFEDSSTAGVFDAVTDANEDAVDAGAVYIYELPSAIPAQLVPRSYIKASNAEANDHFGAALAITTESLVVGAPLEDTDSAGWNGAQDGGASDADRGAIYTFR